MISVTDTDAALQTSSTLRFHVTSVSFEAASVVLDGRVVRGASADSLREMVKSLFATFKIRRLILDTSKLTLIDACGIGVLVEAYLLARKKGARLELLDVPPRLQEVLTITRLATVFPQIVTSSMSADNRG